MPKMLLVGCALLLSCSNEKLVQTLCRADEDCGTGFLCDNYQCAAAQTKSCEVVIDGNPILEPTPHAVSYGKLEAPEATKKIALHNLGNCTLTIFEASLAGGEKSPYTCDLCKGEFPLELFPGRHREVTLEFKAPDVGPFDDALVLLSDDREFPELRVPLHADFRGVPELRVTPNPVDFGYVASGRVTRKTIQITNQGTGVAAITLQAIKLDPSDTVDFGIGVKLDQPLELAPIAVDSKALLSFEAQFHPRSIAQHQVDLVVVTSKGEVRIPFKGNAETPPKMNVNPTSITLGKVPLGQSNYQPLTIVNEGGAPLNVKYKWGGPTPTTDLFAVPSTIPAIAAGAYLELQVAVTATAVGPISGLLLLESNDPTRPTMTIPVTAEGVPGPGPQVVKVELVFENGADSIFDEDFRNVDMSLEHPYGYVCNKQQPNPTNWGNYGKATWIAFGPKEEPERIILADATQDGTYRVMLQYMQDCASLPTDLLAGILGISIDVLLNYLSGGAINVNGKDVGDLIKNLCLDRTNSNATVRVYVNGTLSKEKTVSLGKMGDTVYALDLVRDTGVFTAK